MIDLKKKLIALLLVCGSPLFACGPFFPASFIDEEDARVRDVEEREIVYHLSLLAEHFMPEVIPPSPRSEEQDPKGPRKEYELYEAGVKEITDDPEECFPKAWKSLLELPVAERRYRTARTLYMLGNLALRNGNDDASAWNFYHDLRKAVRDEGCVDNLGLSLDTFNALRRYSSPLGQLRYLPLAARFNASDCEYRSELRSITKRLSAEDRETALKDPYLAEILLLADPKGISRSGHKFLLADRLAMRAYQAGNFTLCADLLKQTPDNSLIKLFLQARFARFSGDTKRSAELLRKWLSLSETLLAKSPEYVFRRGSYDAQDFAWKHEVYGLLGLVTLEEKDYEEALLAFLNAGSWSDAAEVAEQFMSVEALQKFVDANIYRDTGDVGQMDGLDLESRLRHLLARALLRQGKVRESVRYFSKHGKIMEEYLENYDIVNSSSDAEEKAKALFRVGQIQLFYNIELLGYELDPDFYICDGRFADYTPNRRNYKLDLPRFHYRKTIARTFQQVADLTKNENLKFASLLAAGWTLRNGDPAGADPFYKQLCGMKTNPASEFLVKNKWLPPFQSDWRETFFNLKPTDEDLRRYVDGLMTWQASSSGKNSAPSADAAVKKQE